MFTLKKVWWYLSILLLVSVSIMAMGNTGETAEEQRHYYYAAAVHAHPYFIDTHLSLKYTAEKFGVKITTVGPQDWNLNAMAEAIEQIIPKKPDGIMTLMWDSTNLPAVKKAMAAGIPVIVLYTTIPDNGALSYIGLDNYQADLIPETN